MSDIAVQNPDKDGKYRKFLDGSERNVVELPSVFIGKGTYKPGWKWSEHTGVQTGKTSERHIGYILSGQMVTLTADGQEVTSGSGDAFEVGSGHDAWVAGDEPCVALDFEPK